MKTAIKILLLIGVVAYLAFALTYINRPVEHITCTQMDIFIEDTVQEGFLQESYIHNLLSQHKISPEGQEMDQIDLANIEEVLQDCPYISSANCYHTADGKLCVSVVPRQPILHIIAQNGEEYYLDRTGACMPVGNFNLDLCVATGHITKSLASNKLIHLAEFIHDNDFWDNQIEQIYVDGHSNITLSPRVGDHAIFLGEASNLQDKFDRLMLFYEKGLPKTGWNKYETINLAFKGQIVCTKKEKQ